MSLSKKYVRDGNRKIIGSITSGYSAAHLMSSATTAMESQAAPRAFQDHPRRARKFAVRQHE